MHCHHARPDDDYDDRVSDRPSRRGRSRDDDDDYDDRDRPSRRGRSRDDDDEDDRPRSRSGFRCPYCGSGAMPTTKSKMSVAGWIVMIFFILFFIPLFWIGLLMRDEYKVCSQCGTTL